MFRYKRKGIGLNPIIFKVCKLLLLFVLQKNNNKVLIFKTSADESFKVAMLTHLKIYKFKSCNF